jgi:DEAD/DEAH box helicase domain-containing protein
LRGLGAALETVAAVALMCDPRDLGRTLGDGGSEAAAPGRDPLGGRTGGLDPTVFLFDAHPGGVGLVERIFERAEQMLLGARSVIESCPCRAGCPGCVGPHEGAGNKQTALGILAAIGLGA